MPEHKIGTQEECRRSDELAKLEADRRSETRRSERNRLDLPWSRSRRSTCSTPRTARRPRRAFDGRSQLLGLQHHASPRLHEGACPVRTISATDSTARSSTLNHRDITLLCFSRAPSSGYAYKQRMAGSPLRLHLQHRLRLRLRPCDDEEAGAADSRVSREMSTPARLAPEWFRPSRGRAQDGLREGPELDRLRARERDRHHTYTGCADPFVAPTTIPARANAESPTRRARSWAKDEYPD